MSQDFSDIHYVIVDGGENLNTSRSSLVLEDDRLSRGSRGSLAGQHTLKIVLIKFARL